MNRDNFLFAIIGILLGFIIGFMVHGVLSQREAVTRPGTGQQGQMPPNHPPVGSDAGSNNPNTGDSQQVFAQVQEAMKQARENPKDFEAQVTAAKLEYQIQRFDSAIEYLLKANQLKPTDYDVVAMLGVANLDGAHYDAAEKWYRAALLKKPDDIVTLSGLCFVLLKKGDAKGAEAQIDQLAKIDPTSEDLPQFRDQLAQLKAGKK